MSARRCIAALDVGTTSVKVCLFTPELGLLARAACEYSLTTAGDRVEAEAAVYEAAIREGMARALAEAPGWRVAALGLTTQGETLTALDGAGRPLRPFLVWLDSRAAPQAAALAAAVDGRTFYETTGLPEPTGALPLAKLRWLAENEPALFAQAACFALLEDYLLGRLTGRVATEPSLQTSTGWFDIRRDEYWPFALAWAGVTADRLPPLLACGQAAGALTPEAAAWLGLPAGIPVVAGAMDQTAAALAAGCTRPGAVTETTGTALVLAACTDAPVFAAGHRVTVYRHALPGRYLYLPIGNTAGMALRWFRDQFGPDLPPGAAGYAALDRLAAQAPPGCEGLVFLPFLSGSVDPDACPGARGGFVGATLATGRAHFARAVMEGVAFLLADMVEMLAALGCPCAGLRSLGGGASSPFWMQLKADACGLPLETLPCGEAAAMGAALLAGWGSGLIPAGQVPPQSPAARYTPAPAPALAEARRRYQRVWAALRGLYESW